MSDLRRTLRILAIPAFTALLVVAAGLNYQWARWTVEREAHARLDQEWSTMKGYLRIEYDPAAHRDRDQWYYDSNDADQAAAAGSIRERCFIADGNGRVMRASLVSFDSGRILEAVRSHDPGEAVWIARNNQLIRAGVVLDERHRSPYYVALTAPLSADRSSLRPFTFTLAGVILSAVLLGWVLARYPWT
jgi:hypothetical protein